MSGKKVKLIYVYIQTYTHTRVDIQSPVYVQTRRESERGTLSLASLDFHISHFPVFSLSLPLSSYVFFISGIPSFLLPSVKCSYQSFPWFPPSHSPISDFFPPIISMFNFFSHTSVCMCIYIHIYVWELGRCPPCSPLMLLATSQTKTWTPN